MSDTKHAPPPYSVSCIPTTGVIRIKARDGPHIAVMHYHPGRKAGKPAALANAEFIVRACNNYDTLLAACEGLFGLIENGTLVRNIENDGDPLWVMAGLRLVKTLKEAQAAIAAAHERKEAR